MRREIDSESQMLWDKLRKAEYGTTSQDELDSAADAIDNAAKNDCCEAMGKLKKMGWVAFNIPVSLYKVEKVKIVFCPECGRRLA
jgi:hypothetical protein